MTDGSTVTDVQPDDFMPTFYIIEKKKSNVQIHREVTYPIW